MVRASELTQLTIPRDYLRCYVYYGRAKFFKYRAHLLCKSFHDYKISVRDITNEMIWFIVARKLFFAPSTMSAQKIANSPTSLWVELKCLSSYVALTGKSINLGIQEPTNICCLVPNFPRHSLRNS